MTAALSLPLESSHRSHWARGSAISFLMQQGVENRSVLSLAAGLVDEQTLPTALCRDMLTGLFADDATARRALQYGTTAGADGLRVALLDHLARLECCQTSDLPVTGDRIVLTTGSQQMLSLVAETLFNPGDICLVPAPTYFVFLGVLQGVGARAVAVETDAKGLRVEALQQALETIAARGELGRVKLIYVVSDFENPTGLCVAAERRPEIVRLAREWSREHPILVLEDAAYRELRYDGVAAPSLWSHDPERVILAATFSKSFSPGVRVGWGVLPAALVGPVCDRKGSEDFGSAHLNQQLLGRVLQSGRYAAHVETVRAGYRRKRNAMLETLEQELQGMAGVEWVHPQGGLYVWLTLPETVATGFDSDFFRQAVREHEVMYVPGELCYPTDSSLRRCSQMRLSFGVQNEAGVREGIRRLAAAIRQYLSLP